MYKKYFLSFLILLFTLPGLAGAASGGANVNVHQSVSVCVVDGVCSPLENHLSCPADCAAPTSTPPTTPTTTPPTDTGGTSSGGSGFGTSYLPGSLKIHNIEISPGILGADISWETDVDSSAQVHWGQTRDYSGGSLSSIFYSKDHSVHLSGLTPGTLYRFKILAQARSGQEGWYEGSFITSPARSVPNVGDFGLSGDSGGIVLDWKNPKFSGFDSVTIVRKTTGFPLGPADGTVVYTGNGEFVYDEDVRINTWYYYGIYVKNVTGEYSSGVVGSFVVTPRGGEPQEPGDAETGHGGTDISTGTSTEPEEPGEGEESGVRYLRLSNFLFLQSGGRVMPREDHFSLKSGTPLQIMISKSDLPQNVTSVIFEWMSEGTQDWNSYQVSDRDESDALSSMLPGYLKKGNYPFKILVNISGGDYYVLRGTFDVANSFTTAPREEGQSQAWGFWICLLIIVLILLLLALLILLIARKRDDEEEYDDIDANEAESVE